MAHLKFDPAKLEKLNDPGRFDTLKPDVMEGALGLSAPGTIVEIGAGTGIFAAEFARRYPMAVVYAADMSDVMIEWMRVNRPEVASGRVVPVLSAETRVPLEDASADAVYMVNLHHELAEPGAIYAEAFRLLRQGGRVLVADWLPEETPKGPPLHVRATAAHVRRVLAVSGFARLEIHTGLPWHWLVTASRP